MKDKKKVIITGVIVTIFVLSLFGYFFVSKQRSTGTISEAQLPLPQLRFQNSIPVGTALSLPKLTSISGRIIPTDTKRVFVFVSRTCGSCEYISIAIPKLAETFNKLTWIYIEKSDEPPLIGNPKISNLYIIKNAKANLSSIFNSKYTPTFFLVDKNNKLVWKRRGFIIPDYYSLKDILFAFQNNDYPLLEKTYQRNLQTGKLFPKIVVYTYPDHKKLVIPDDLKGKPTLIFIFHYSCKACLTVINAIPDQIKNSKEVNKIIVFSPFSERLNKESINFGEKFGFREIVRDLQVPIIEVTWNNIDETFKNTNTMYINDYDFSFQNFKCRIKNFYSTIWATHSAGFTLGNSSLNSVFSCFIWIDRELYLGFPVKFCSCFCHF